MRALGGRRITLPIQCDRRRQFTEGTQDQTEICWLDAWLVTKVYEIRANFLGCFLQHRLMRPHPYESQQISRSGELFGVQTHSVRKILHDVWLEIKESSARAECRIFSLTFQTRWFIVVCQWFINGCRFSIQIGPRSISHFFEMDFEFKENENGKKLKWMKLDVPKNIIIPSCELDIVEDFVI